MKCNYNKPFVTSPAGFWYLNCPFALFCGTFSFHPLHLETLHWLHPLFSLIGYFPETQKKSLKYIPKIALQS